MNSHMLTHESGSSPGVWFVSFGLFGKGVKQMGRGGYEVARKPGVGWPSLPAHGCHVSLCPPTVAPPHFMNCCGGSAERCPPERCSPPAAYI